MEKNKRLYYFSHLLILFTGFIILFSILIENPLKEKLLLIPQNIIEYNQWWRVLTYPLSIEPIENILLFFITFLVFARKLEENYRSIMFPIIILANIILQGILLSALFFNENLTFSGMVGINFFIITHFVLNNHKSNIIILNRYSMPVIFFVTFLIFFWLTVIFGKYVFSNNENYLNQNISMAIIGIFLGTMAFTHLKFTNKNVDNITGKKALDKKTVSPQQLLLTNIANRELKKVNQRLQEDLIIKFTDMASYYDEDKLNQILDKINLFGYDSLNQDEIDFLNNYSKN